MIPLLPIVVGALATMPVGFVWYSSLLFAKPWMTLSKLSAKNMKNSQSPLPFLASLFSALVMGFVLSLLITLLHIQTLQGAWKLGLLVWFGFDFLPQWVRHLFDRRPLELLMINTGYQAVNVLLIGWILVSWQY